MSRLDFFQPERARKRVESSEHLCVIETSPNGACKWPLRLIRLNNNPCFNAEHQIEKSGTVPLGLILHRLPWLLSGTEEQCVRAR